MARNTARPLSPFTTIWKWGVHMTISIANRAMAVGLATVGVVALVWWLTAMASGEDAYNYFMGWARSWYGMVFPIGLSFAFFLHMCAGIRHFVMDAGAGFELKTNRTWAWGAIIASVLMTGAMWIYIFRKAL